MKKNCNKEISIPWNVWPAPADMTHWFIPTSEMWLYFQLQKDSYSKQTCAAAFDPCMHSAEEQTPLGLHWHTGRCHSGECCYVCLPLQVKAAMSDIIKMIKSWNIQKKEADKGWNDFKHGTKTHTDKLQNFCLSMIAQNKLLDYIKSENSNGMINIGSAGLVVPFAFLQVPESHLP